VGAGVSMPAAHCESPQIAPVASGDHAVCEVPGTQAWQALAGFGSPDGTQAPPITHEVSSIGLSQALVASTQVSAVQANASSQRVPEPAQVPIASQASVGVHHRPSSQARPTGAGLHAEDETDGSQTWQMLAGFPAPVP